MVFDGFPIKCWRMKSNCPRLGLTQTDLSWVPTSLQDFRLCVSHCLIQCPVWIFRTNFIARALNMYTNGQTAICSSDELHHASGWNFAIFWSISLSWITISVVRSPYVSQCPYPVFRKGFVYFACCVIVFFCVELSLSKSIHHHCDWLSFCFPLPLFCQNELWLTHTLIEGLKQNEERAGWRYQNGWIFGKVPKGGGVAFSIQKNILQVLDLYTGL